MLVKWFRMLPRQQQLLYLLTVALKRSQELIFFFACLKKEIEDTKIIMLLGFASLTSNQGNKEKNNFIFAFFFQYINERNKEFSIV